MSEEKKNDKFKVYDKRKFDASGNPREPDEEEASEETENNGAEAPKADTRDGKESAARQQTGYTGPPPKLDFKMFVISLGSQAMMALGLLAPQGEKPDVNIEAAHQLIEILAMLREKTRGNLEADEITTIDNLLYDLRMSYVEIKKRQEG